MWTRSVPFSSGLTEDSAPTTVSCTLASWIFNSFGMKSPLRWQSIGSSFLCHGIESSRAELLSFLKSCQCFVLFYYFSISLPGFVLSKPTARRKIRAIHFSVKQEPRRSTTTFFSSTGFNFGSEQSEAIFFFLRICAIWLQCLLAASLKIGAEIPFVGCSKWASLSVNIHYYQQQNKILLWMIYLHTFVLVICLAGFEIFLLPARNGLCSSSRARMLSWWTTKLLVSKDSLNQDLQNDECHNLQ